MENSSRFEITQTPLSGLSVVTRMPRTDDRGFFERLYCEEEFLHSGMTKPIKQINRSFTKNIGAVRGMHFQHEPFAECKVVSCISGSVFDVAIDLRRTSATFLQWFGVELSSENNKCLVIPEGFAHGFQTTSNDCELVYLHTEKYNSEAEGAVSALDPLFGITWPLEITDMSERDMNHPFNTSEFGGIRT
jgi:dTDP-4-dehydrorhamnose 3,5-epimerase